MIIEHGVMPHDIHRVARILRQCGEASPEKLHWNTARMPERQQRGDAPAYSRMDTMHNDIHRVADACRWGIYTDLLNTRHTVLKELITW